MEALRDMIEIFPGNTQFAMVSTAADGDHHTTGFDAGAVLQFHCQTIGVSIHRLDPAGDRFDSGPLRLLQQAGDQALTVEIAFGELQVSFRNHRVGVGEDRFLEWEIFEGVESSCRLYQLKRNAEALRLHRCRQTRHPCSDDHQRHTIGCGGDRLTRYRSHHTGARIDGELQQRSSGQVSDDEETRNASGKVSGNLGKRFHRTCWPLQMKPVSEFGQPPLHAGSVPLDQIDLAIESGDQNARVESLAGRIFQQLQR